MEVSKKCVCVSFRSTEEDIYNYLCSKRDKSCYIKDLIEKDMNLDKGFTPGEVREVKRDRAEEFKTEIENEYEW